MGAGRGHEDDGTARLSFPDLPRLRLDQLLDQLVTRARELSSGSPEFEELLRQVVARSEEVLGTQGRLRGLLRATQLVTGELELAAMLRRIVEAARELIGARYAALGVLAPAGGLAEFVNTGLPAGAAETIGHLPEGKGLLGALIDDPRPIRLRRLGEDPRAVGFPPGHPPMSTFLGVPIRVRGEVFGNLYLTESSRGEFTAEDEELLTALAAAAGAAVTQARLYQAAWARGEWMQASVALTRQVLAAEPGSDVQPLRSAAERSRDIADAELVVLVRPDDPGWLYVDVAIGPHAATLSGRRLPVEESLAGEVFTTGRPERVAQLVHQAGLAQLLAGELELGPVLAVPLIGSREVHGVLCVARRLGRNAFTAEDLEMAGGFANHAALAIELAEARAEQQRAALFGDRERIAADLHDHVIQRLFAAGLSLQALVGPLGPGPLGDRLLAAIRSLDETILQIRSSIFQLQQESRVADTGVRARLLGVLADLTPALGFEPAIRFSGGLEGTVSDDLLEDVLGVVREALTNVARHAAAQTAEASVAASAGRLAVEITDDGRGIGERSRTSGLGNLQRRAAARGGTCTVEPRLPSGTRLAWTVPLPRAPAAQRAGEAAGTPAGVSVSGTHQRTTVPPPSPGPTVA
jgi:signal transduction histidine kinase